MIPNPEIFYRSYQVNYYDYIQLTLNEILQSIEEQDLSNYIISYDKEDHKRAIKILIRQTLFHAIETLFELVFALKLNSKGHTEDKYIIRNLSVSHVPNEKINNIAKDINELSFLDEMVNAGKFTISLGHYIFFFGLYETKLYDHIEESLKAIKQALQTLAIEMDNRFEYNSIKHGLRVMPIMKKFMAYQKEDMGKKLELDLADSYTFYSESLKSGRIEFRTKTFDTERDIKLTNLCSNIIWNIIVLRRVGIFKDMNEVPICFFSMDFVDKANKFTTRKLDIKIEMYKE